MEDHKSSAVKEVASLTVEERLAATKLLVNTSRRSLSPKVQLEGFWKAGEAAKFLGVSTKTLTRWHQRNYGPPRIIYKRHVMYDKKKLFNWLHGLGG